MKGRIGLIPWTNSNTNPATDAPFVSYPVPRTFLHIERPFFISIVHHLILEGDRSGWAIAGTLFALRAKVLNAEINGFVHS